MLTYQINEFANRFVNIFLEFSWEVDVNKLSAIIKLCKTQLKRNDYDYHYDYYYYYDYDYYYHYHYHYYHYYYYHDYYHYY